MVNGVDLIKRVGVKMSKFHIVILGVLCLCSIMWASSLWNMTKLYLLQLSEKIIKNYANLIMWSNIQGHKTLKKGLRRFMETEQRISETRMWTEENQSKSEVWQKIFPLHLNLVGILLNHMWTSLIRQMSDKLNLLGIQIYCQLN